jgi:hypothetical protein
MAVKLSALRAGRALLPGRLLVVTSIRGWLSLKVILRLGGLGKLKKFNDLKGNRTRDFQIRSIMHQLTMLRCAPSCSILFYFKYIHYIRVTVNAVYATIFTDFPLFLFVLPIATCFGLMTTRQYKYNSHDNYSTYNGSVALVFILTFLLCAVLIVCRFWFGYCNLTA